ncbi:MAG TPA: tRNA uracil 4-sulfurtransferase ThiI [Coriobacteriia bacterium]
MFERICLVHYNEIGLKGRNRAQFERRLRDNIGAALAGLPTGSVELIASRVLVQVRDPKRTSEVAKRIATIPGVQFVSPGYRTAREPDEMERAALLVLREVGPFATFAVESKRSNTDYAENSMAINRRIGAFLQRETGAGVNLSAPDATVRVAVVQGSAYISSAVVQGIGGLPVGMSGRVVSLLSAGIDSPVASWRMMRRGALLVGVHFSGRPQTSDASERLVFEIGERLAHTGGLARIYVVPFGDLQKEIALASPPDLRVLLYRRLMIRVAEEIATAERAKALVTGESLGQVASQTLENIAAVDEAATLPVLRPLIGNDKLEIIADATRIGTYEISITPHADCCTLFMPRTPETHARLGEVLSAWDALPHERMVADALSAITWRDFGGQGYRPPKAWPAPLPDVS